MAFAGLALLFLELDAQFAGFAQILVYIGAVAILIVFAILLTRGSELPKDGVFSKHLAAGLVIAAGVFAVLGWAVLAKRARSAAANRGSQPSLCTTSAMRWWAATCCRSKSSRCCSLLPPSARSSWPCTRKRGPSDAGLPRPSPVIFSSRALLFAIGLAGALTRRNAILVLIGIELMLNAANLNLIAFWRYGPHPEALTGMMFAIFSIAVAAAEAAVGLGLVIAIHRHAQHHRSRQDEQDEGVND